MVIEIFRSLNPIYEEIDKFLEQNLKEGNTYKEVVEGVENLITQNTQLAFPVNFSVNNVAAHDTAYENDTRVLKEGDVVKVDVGVHKDGYIIDSAKTYIIGKDKTYRYVVKATQEALKEVVKSIEVGMKIKEVGEIIESVAEKHGCGVVVNLTGHKIDQYTIHSTYSIPNIRNNINTEINHGDIIAIEPFFTNTKHISVKDAIRCEIYSLANTHGTIRSRYAQILLQEIRNKFGNKLPFASRWITSLKGFLKQKSIAELVSKNILHAYPVLYYPDESVKIAQSELTLVMEDKVHTYGFSFK